MVCMNDGFADELLKTATDYRFDSDDGDNVNPNTCVS
jgi:hypothetical protein